MALPAPQRPPEGEPVGGTITFAPEGYARLEALAAKKGISVPEMVFEALSLMQWFDAALEDGESILVRHAPRPWEVVKARR
jgi:class 3 adenylate cyclase